MKHNRFKRAMDALRLVFSDKHSGVYTTEQLKQLQEEVPSPTPEREVSVLNCVSKNPFKRLWFVLKYGIFYDNHGEAYIAFPSLASDTEYDGRTYQCYRNGCYMEISFKRKPTPKLEDKVLLPLVEIMERNTGEGELKE